jgi:hypothetical protein
MVERKVCCERASRMTRDLTARSSDSGGGEVEQTGTNIGRGNGLGWDMGMSCSGKK